MSIFVSEDPKKGLTTLRHTWRGELFSEFGEEVEIRAHRAESTFDTDTEDLVVTKHDRVVSRKLSELPDGPRQTILAFFDLMDSFEMEDVAKEREQKEA